MRPSGFDGSWCSACGQHITSCKCAHNPETPLPRTGDRVRVTASITGLVPVGSELTVADDDARRCSRGSKWIAFSYISPDDSCCTDRSGAVQVEIIARATPFERAGGQARIVARQADSDKRQNEVVDAYADGISRGFEAGRKAGLHRGLELAKEHARIAGVTGTVRFISWEEADAAVDKECG